MSNSEELVWPAPFQPFKIHMSSGETLTVTHPEQITMTETKVIVDIGGDPKHRLVEHEEHCDYSHITQPEELSKPSTA